MESTGLNEYTRSMFDVRRGVTLALAV